MNLARFGLGILTNNEWLSDCKKKYFGSPVKSVCRGRKMFKNMNANELDLNV